MPVICMIRERCLENQSRVSAELLPKKSIQDRLGVSNPIQVLTFDSLWYTDADFHQALSLGFSTLGPMIVLIVLV
jgi:hypothetical protein